MNYTLNKELLSGENVMSNNSSEYEVSKYMKSRFCCCNQYKFGTATLWGHWRVSLAFPIIFCFLLVSSFVHAAVCLFISSSGSTEKALLFIFLLLTFLLYACTCINIIVTGPGYIPYYYAGLPDVELITANRTGNMGRSSANCIDDSPGGFAISKVQIDYAKNNKKPPGSIFADEAGRFVIRPDHYCKWLSCWIGKRNHKIFILSLLYGSIYFAMTTVVLFVSLVGRLEYGYLYHIVAGLFLLADVIVFLYFISSLSRQMDLLLRGRTSIDVDWFNKGSKRENMKDVFGDSNIFKFFLPISPFKGYENRDLISGYPTIL